jgi:site-specific DNA-methyltransferase (adenine-specific)
MKDIPDKSVDLIICDLPYGCLTGGAGKEKAKRKENGEGVVAGCAWDVPIDLDAFWEQVRRIRKDDHTPTIHFCTTKFGYELIRSNEKEFRYDLVWSKSNAVGFLLANKKPMSSHEMIYVFSKAGANYNRIDISGNYQNTISPNHKRSKTSNTIPRVADVSSSNDGKRCVKSVVEIANKKTKDGHPTQKPTELYKWLIERYSKEGDTILDPTFGSGNSVFTAVELGRKAIGIEKDKKFFEKAQTNASISIIPPPHLQ